MICDLLKYAVTIYFVVNFAKKIHCYPTNNRDPRLSVVDWTDYNYHEPSGPGTYAFGYDIEDPQTNNVQFRNEERHANGTVTGSYGYVDPDGNVHTVNYIADHLGYRATVENTKRGQLKPVAVPGGPYEDGSPLVSPDQSRYYSQKQYTQPTRFFNNFQQGARIVTPNPPVVNNQFSNVINSDLYEPSNSFSNVYQPFWSNVVDNGVYNGNYGFYYDPNPSLYPIRTY